MKRLSTFLLALLLMSIGANAESSWTAPTLPTSTLVDGGKYYLYNSEAKQYACMGNYKWGTNAIFGDEGLLFTLASASTTDYDQSSVTAYTLTSSNGQFFYDGEYIYCDGSSKTTGIYFVFTETSAGSKVYKIHGTYAATSTYIGYDPETVSNDYGTHAVLPALTGTTGQGIEWKLQSADDIDLYNALVILYNTLVEAEEMGMTDTDTDYKSAGEVYTNTTSTVDDINKAIDALELAMEALASADNPVDVTHLYITNPSFDDSTSDIPGWTSSNFWYQSTPHSNSGITISGYAETWVASNSYLDNTALSQTLALPKGTYRLEADVVATQQGNESLEVSGVYLCAGSQMTSVDTGNGLPEHYTVEFYVTNENGESADIGMKVYNTDANWVAVDNFVLYYLGEEVTAVTDTESEYKKGDAIVIDDETYYVQCDNMVANHSFELGFDGWTEAVDFATGITFTNFELRSDGAKDGNVYLVGTTNNGISGTGSLGTAWAIETNKTYYFCYWIKNLTNESDTQYLKTSLTSTLGTESYTLGYPSSVSSDWQKVEYVFDSGSYSYVQVDFRWLESHWGFDNFQLYEIDENLLPIDWTMTDAGYGTLILPFDYDLTDGKLTAYSTGTVTSDGDDATLSLTEVTGSLTANTPYIIGGTAGTYTFTGTPEEATEGLTSGKLTGTYTTMDCYDLLAAAGENTVYLLQNQNNVVAFYPVVAPDDNGNDNSKDATLTPYHCYLTLTASDLAATSGTTPAKLSFSFGGEATAIVAVEGAEVDGNGAIYDLSGRKVSKAVKGVYIQNGKKVLVK